MHDALGTVLDELFIVSYKNRFSVFFSILLFYINLREFLETFKF